MSNNNSAERITLDINATAPAFNMIDTFGRMINLQDYKGKKVFIGFFRHAGCPFCNLRVHLLQEKMKNLRQKIWRWSSFLNQMKKSFYPVFFTKRSDPALDFWSDKIWYQTYGIENSALKSTMSHLTSFIQTVVQAKLKKLPMHMMTGGESIKTMPAEFLLDENLIIRKVHSSKGLNERMSLEHIMEFAESSKA